MNREPFTRILLVSFAIFLLFCFGSATRSEMLDTDHLPASIGISGSLLTSGLFFDIEIPIYTSRSLVLNSGIFTADSNNNYNLLVFEIDYLEHLGTQKTNVGWFYRGIGIGEYRDYDSKRENWFLSLLAGRRQELFFGSIYAEANLKVNSNKIFPLLKIGIKGSFENLSWLGNIGLIPMTL
ncbi:MAG: hypothetical protein HQ564_02810 [Candidatus Saganbacteria bacterium]|nr:hypothetical protein [Candidatus Saganbacteria bacterium]